jgi:cell division protein FtsL
VAAWAPSARAEQPQPLVRPRPRPRRVAAPASERRLAGGVLWIGLLGVLLVGVVALNVAVLRLNMQLEQLSERRLELEAENALLASKVSAAMAPTRTERLARTKLGLEPAADPTYAELRQRR